MSYIIIISVEKILRIHVIMIQFLRILQFECRNYLKNES